jgi:hypothetical protein
VAGLTCSTAVANLVANGPTLPSRVAAAPRMPRGSSATDGVVRRRRNTWPSAVEVKISGFDVVEGPVRIYVRSMAGEPGRGLSGANDDDSVLVGVVGWHGGWLVGVLCGRRGS